MTLLQNKFLKYYIGYNDFFDEIDKVSSIQNKSNLAFDIIKYDDHNYEIHVALAGIEPNQIKINTVNDYLVLDVKNKPLSITWFEKMGLTTDNIMSTRVSRR